MPEFQPFPKMARLNREVTITEKIDGTNAQIHITEDGLLYAGSRKRWITRYDDNFGFASWAMDHHDELRDGLGAGTHFGEWWGSGIQRGYGLEKGEKRFSLFNTTRWATSRPPCCSVVPVLFQGTFTRDSECQLSQAVEYALGDLETEGSFAAPGFMRPEGIVVFHSASNQCFKVTIENDEMPKALVQS